MTISKEKKTIYILVRAFYIMYLKLCRVPELLNIFVQTVPDLGSINRDTSLSSFSNSARYMTVRRLFSVVTV